LALNRRTNSTTIRYVHTDNLGGTSVVTASSAAVSEAQDFYPYGGIRIDSRTNYGGEKRKYAGTEYDSLSGLNCMQARYQNSNRGQFISEDPLYLADPSMQNLDARSSPPPRLWWTEL
jgi:RHS repeat-associated protein